MSYSRCFVCGADNFSGNETRISVHRVVVDKETLEHLNTTWQADICDECFYHMIEAVSGLRKGRMLVRLVEKLHGVEGMKE